MSEELKPCPFCGGKARLSHGSDGDTAKVRCELWGRGCMGAGASCDTNEQAIAAWNRRATPPSPSTASEVSELPPVLAWAVESNVGGGMRVITKLTTDEGEADRYASAQQAEYAGSERKKIALCARAALASKPVARESALDTLRRKDHDFAAHLDRCSEMVATWPRWKQSIDAPPVAEVDVEAERKLMLATEPEFAGLSEPHLWHTLQGWLAARRSQEGAKDAERLDWMARHGAALRSDPKDGRWYLDAPYHTGISSVDDYQRFYSAREAIDAAIAATQTKESQHEDK